MMPSVVQELLLPLLPHPERALRQTAGSCISAIVQQSSLGTWPQLVSALQSCLSTEDANALGGALDSLFKVG
jgi:transportin-1